jgi:NodT family efflux transporter outer membrane factor (OMF) lipoprotein
MAYITSKRLNKIFSCIQLSLVLLAAAGCRSGYRAQALPPPAAALETALQEAGIVPPFEITEGLPNDWWTLFNDEQLSTFIQSAFARNPTLQAARANIQLAAYNAQRVRAMLFPNLLWGADVSRQKFSETGIIPFNINPVPGAAPTPATGGINGIPIYFTQYETELTLTYDFDLWGKNRNTWRAALSEVQANIADEAFSRLQLGISVAQVYFQLQIDYKRQQIAQTLVDNKNRYREYIQRRMNASLENVLALNTAEVNLTSAKQALLQIQGDIAVKEYQLKTYLAGNFEEEIFNTNIVEQPLPKVPLPINLPLNLIARRPDITAQLWLIESAGRQIEVAQAGFYPDFNLTALFGFQTIHLHELFRWPSTFFNVDPAVSLPIFDGGRLLANLRYSEVNYDLAIFQYNNLVLNAARDVLDGIAVLRNANQQLQEFRKSTGYQEELFKLTSLRTAHSLNSNLDTLVSEGNLLAARDQEMIALGSTFQAMLALIKALGGGYEVCNDKD